MLGLALLPVGSVSSLIHPGAEALLGEKEGVVLGEGFIILR